MHAEFIIMMHLGMPRNINIPGAVINIAKSLNKRHINLVSTVNQRDTPLF